MQNLSPDFAAELARQLAFLSAVLGGFAATFAGTLLAMNSATRVAGWAFGAAVVAATGLIVSTVAFTGAGLVVRATTENLASSIPKLSGIAGVSFAVGVYALFTALGLSGWVRSREAGWVTAVAAGIGVILVTVSLVNTG